LTPFFRSLPSRARRSGSSIRVSPRRWRRPRTSRSKTPRSRPARFATSGGISTRHRPARRSGRETRNGSHQRPHPRQARHPSRRRGQVREAARRAEVVRDGHGARQGGGREAQEDGKAGGEEGRCSAKDDGRQEAVAVVVTARGLAGRMPAPQEACPTGRRSCGIPTAAWDWTAPTGPAAGPVPAIAATRATCRWNTPRTARHCPSRPSAG